MLDEINDPTFVGVGDRGCAALALVVEVDLEAGVEEGVHLEALEDGLRPKPTSSRIDASGQNVTDVPRRLRGEGPTTSSFPVGLPPLTNSILCRWPL